MWLYVVSEISICKLQVRWDSETVCWDNFGKKFIRKSGGIPGSSSISLASIVVIEVVLRIFRSNVQGGNSRLSLGQTVAIPSEVVLRDLRCGACSQIQCNCAWGETPSPLVEIQVLSFLSKTIVKSCGELFWNIDSYHTLTLRIFKSMLQKPLFFVSLCYLPFSTIHHHCFHSIGRDFEIVFVSIVRLFH